MGCQHLNLILTICLVIANGINADNTCKRSCSRHESGILTYNPGNVYEYSFESVMLVGVNSVTNNDATSLKITGSAKLFAEGNCGYTLQINGVKVQSSKDGTEKKLTNNIQKPVHFTMENGTIYSELCSDTNENLNSLNIKRAIVSLFQTTTEGEHETDIFGRCPTYTSSTNVGETLVIHKLRNLNKCAYRETLSNGILTGVANEQAGIKSTMLLNAQYSKESKIVNGLIEHVESIEEYKYGSESKSTPGTHAKVMTTLKLKNKAGIKSAAPTTGENGISIIFEKPYPLLSKNIAVLKKVLNDLVQSSSDYVHVNSSKQFMDLIRLMRSADYETLLELGAMPHANNVLARKVYLDALFRIGTSSGAKAIIKQLNKMNEKEKHLAILSLNLVQNVDKETLNIVSELIQNSPKEVFMTVGNLVSKYCKGKRECKGKEIDSISKKFGDNLKNCKAHTKADEKRMIFILKGISNSHELSKNLVQVLAECTSSNSARSNRLRVAALHAFRSISCEDVVQKKALQLLSDRNEDSELRIEAYLAAIQCPNAELANKIAEIVNSETVHQVGGFIASNLATIRDSTDPHRENQKYHFANIRVVKKFPKNYRRYSFNNEMSYKFDAFGLSASSDYKLLYSQDGFLPRSAYLNLTTELFGTNFNLFEANIRQENLENILEYFAGPKGLLNKDFEEIIKVVGGEVRPDNDRQRRSIADESSKVYKKYKTYGSKSIDDLNIDLSLKLFGTEMFFLSFGDDVPTSLDDLIKEFSTIFENAKRNISSFDKEFVGHHFLLDAEFVYPTGVGVSFELSAQGFVSSKIDVAAEINIDSFLEQNWKDTKLRVKIVPSFDILGSIKAGFNSGVLSTGLKVTTNVQSATGADVKFEIINDGHGFNFDIKLPREKLELLNIDLNAEFYVVEIDKVTKHIDLKIFEPSKEQKYEFCYNQVEFLGVDVCFKSTSQLTEKLNSPHNSNLFNRLSYSLFLTLETHIQIKGFHTPATASENQKWVLEYSTPGSTIPHDASIILEIGSNPKTFIRLAFKQQNFNIAVETGITNDENELILYGQFEQNDNVKRSKIGFVKNGNEYSPIIEINDHQGKKNDINGYIVTGKIVKANTKDTESKYTFNSLQLSRDAHKVLSINGWASVAPLALSSELQIEFEQSSYNVETEFKFLNSLYNFKFFISDAKTPENVIGASALFSHTNQDKFKVDISMKGFMWHVQTTSDIKNQLGDSNTIISSNFKNHLLIKHNNENYGDARLDGSIEKNKFYIAAAVSHNKVSSSLTVDFACKQKSKYDYLLKMNAKHKKAFVDIEAKCDFIDNRYVLDNTLSTSLGTNLIVKGRLGPRFNKQDIFIDLHGSAKSKSMSSAVQWIVKVIGSQDKTASEVKIMKEGSEVLKFVGESVHTDDKISACKSSLDIKNLISNKNEIKFGKSGKGELSVWIEIQGTEPVHQLDLVSKFHIQAPNYDFDIILNLDADKKVYIKSENIIEKGKITTKNLIDVAEKKTTFDANMQTKGDWKFNGEITGNFNLVIPNGKSLDGSVKRKVSTNQKTGTIQGSLDIQLNDNISFEQKQSLALNVKLDKLNSKSKDIATALKLTYSDHKDKITEVKSHLKHLPKSQNKMIDFHVGINSESLKKPIDFTINIDEYDSKHAVGHINVKLSDSLYGKLEIQYNVGENYSPITFKIQSFLNNPNSNWKHFELDTEGTISKPNSVQDFYHIEIDFKEKISSNHYITLKSLFKGSPKFLTINFDLESDMMKGPVGFEFAVDSVKKTRDVHQGSKHKYVFGISQAETYFKSSGDFSFEGNKNMNLFLTFDSSMEALKKIDVVIHGQRVNEDTSDFKLDITYNQEKYVLDIQTFHGMHKKGFDMNVVLAKMPPIEISSFIEQLGDKKVKGSLAVVNLMDLDIKGQVEAAFTGIDTFYIIADWNSEKLKLKGYELKVNSVKNAVLIKFKNSEEIFFDGSINIASKRESNNAVIEGQGQLQYKGKTQSVNFRLVRQTFELATDKEIGFSYTFNGNLAALNAVSTFKITNREFNTKFSICEEKKQCTNIQLQSTVEKDDNDLTNIQHSVLILIDLRELGYPYEFDFQSKSVKHGLKYQYNLDSSIISNNNMKYHLLLNVLPSGTKLQLKLPQREIHLETSQIMPPIGQIVGQYQNSLRFYIDKKNKPNDVLVLLSEYNINTFGTSAFNSNGFLKFEHPEIRPLAIYMKLDSNFEKPTIDAQVELDIFKKPDQKVLFSSLLEYKRNNNILNISTNNRIVSTGLQVNYELSGHTAYKFDAVEYDTELSIRNNNNVVADVHLLLNKNMVDAVASVMNESVLKLKTETSKESNGLKQRSTLQLAGYSPFTFESSIQPLSTSFALEHSKLLVLKTEFNVGKDARILLESNQKPLIDVQLILNPSNFSHSSYNVNENELNTLLDTLRSNIKDEAKEATKKIQLYMQETEASVGKQLELSKECLPEIDSFLQNYERNLNEILKELEVDPSFKELFTSLKSWMSKFFKGLKDFSTMIKRTYEKIISSLQEIWTELVKMFKESILPSWEDLLQSASQLYTQLVSQIVKLWKKGFEPFSETMEKYSPIIRKYAKGLNDSLEPFVGVLLELIQSTYAYIEDIVQTMTNYLESLDAFDTLSRNIKTTVEKLKIKEKILYIIDDIFEKLHSLPTTRETSQFIDKVHTYISAKLKNEPLNDEEYIRDIGSLLAQSISSLFTHIAGAIPNFSNLISTGSWNSVFQHVSPMLDVFTNISSILSFRLSFFNYLINEDFRNWFTNEYYNTWLYVKDFELKGHIIDGKHVITFDDQYYTFTGSCKYILAQDTADNNFTVISQVNNGRHKSIILIDKDGSFMELSDSGVLKINGKSEEFPHHNNGMHAWRLYYTAWLHSEYGVTIMCTTDLKVCHINVNGFYTSKTRGLLGNGNAEPNDDYVQIDGKIVDIEPFINNYGIGKCNPASLSPPSKHHEICSEIFGFDSPLAFGFYAINSKPFKEVCHQSVLAAEKEKEQAACTVALAYGSALKLKNKFALLPSRCLKCPGGQRDIGQEFTVKVPNNKADLIFVVDMATSPNILHNLISPTIKDIRESLKNRGLTDIFIGIVAYNESQIYPALLTSDNGKINFNGDLSDIKLEGPSAFCTECFAQILNDNKLQDIFEYFMASIKTIFPQSDEKAFKLALDYPFRSGSAKSVIAVSSKSIDNKSLVKFVRAQLIGGLTNYDSTILHLIGPINTMSVDGLPSEKLIGFNTRLVSTIDGKDSKKRQKLQYDQNLGIDLIMKNNGWVFRTNNFEKMTPQDHKKFVGQITNSVSDSLFKTEINADCACIPFHGIHAHHKCITKSSTFVPNKKPKSS